MTYEPQSVSRKDGDFSEKRQNLNLKKAMQNVILIYENGERWLIETADKGNE